MTRRRSGEFLRQSLEAALEAQSIEPASEEARRFVVNRRARLRRYESAAKQAAGQ